MLWPHRRLSCRPTLRRDPQELCAGRRASVRTSSCSLTLAVREAFRVSGAHSDTALIAFLPGTNNSASSSRDLLMQ